MREIALRGAQAAPFSIFYLMAWKFQNGEQVYFRSGVVVRRGAIAYTPALPAIADDGEELYQISLEENVRTVISSSNIFREKAPAIAAALLEIEKLYGVWVREYLSAVRDLGRVE